MQEIPKLTTESNEIKKEKKKKRYINYINFKITLKKKNKQSVLWKPDFYRLKAVETRSKSVNTACFLRIKFCYKLTVSQAHKCLGFQSALVDLLRTLILSVWWDSSYLTNVDT